MQVKQTTEGFAVPLLNTAQKCDITADLTHINKHTIGTTWFGGQAMGLTWMQLRFMPRIYSVKKDRQQAAI